MKPIIEDDVLFHNTNNDDFEFLFDYLKGTLGAWNIFNDTLIGKLYIHFDESVKDSLEEEGLKVYFERCSFVYINNEVVYLDNLPNLGYKY